MHKNGIIHCNLNQSNINFKKALNANEMTMNDIRKRKTAMTPCYTAPELFSDNGIYSFKTNLWALWYITYEKALDHLLFFEERVDKLIMKIINDEANFNKKNLINIQWNSWKLLKNYWK